MPASVVGEHMDVNRIVLARWQMKTIERWQDTAHEQEGTDHGSTGT